MLTLFLIAAVVWFRQPSPIVRHGTTPVVPQGCFPGIGQKIKTLNPGEGGYLPKHAFYQDEKRDRFVSNWYTRYLHKMNEPSLLVAAHDQSASYRFLWLRSFHPTVAVRVWSTGESRVLSVKELAREGQSQSSDLLLDRIRPLNDEEWGAIVKLVEESCFWSSPPTENEPAAMDGAWWVLEGTQQNYYHVATRQSPDSGAYRELGLYLLQLAGLPLDESAGEVY